MWSRPRLVLGNIRNGYKLAFSGDSCCFLIRTCTRRGPPLKSVVSVITSILKQLCLLQSVIDFHWNVWKSLCHHISTLWNTWSITNYYKGFKPQHQSVGIEPPSLVRLTLSCQLRADLYIFFRVGGREDCLINCLIVASVQVWQSMWATHWESTVQGHRGKFALSGLLPGGSSRTGMILLGET